LRENSWGVESNAGFFFLAFILAEALGLLVAGLVVDWGLLET
jgi:hypothetical protein